jgi:hypothetical protein
VCPDLKAKKGQFFLGNFSLFHSYIIMPAFGQGKFQPRSQGKFVRVCGRQANENFDKWTRNISMVLTNKQTTCLP